MDLTKLFSLSYLFERLPSDGFSWTFRISLLILFVGAIVLAIFAQKKAKNSGPIKKFWQKMIVWGWTTGSIGLLLMLFREVRAIYLSARFWIFIWIFIMIIWLLLNIIYRHLKVPAKEELIKQQKEFDRYLPKKKS